MPTNEYIEDGLFQHRRVNDPDLENRTRKDGPYLHTGVVSLSSERRLLGEEVGSDHCAFCRSPGRAACCNKCVVSCNLLTTGGSSFNCTVRDSG